MKKIIILMTLILHSTNSAFAAPGGVYGTLSIIPGLGQAVNGNVIEGISWFATIAILSGNKNTVAQSVGSDLWFYNMYDAYRDATPAGNKVSKENIFENSIAVINPLNILDPIGAPALALYGPSMKFNHITGKNVIKYGFVGVGEEALFRGFLFPAFTNVTNSKWIGAITSSVVFGLAHTSGNVVPRMILGMFYCWELDRNKYDLRKNIFSHAWIDVKFSTHETVNGASLNTKLDF
jgi:hypothetical protein